MPKHGQNTKSFFEKNINKKEKLDDNFYYEENNTIEKIIQVKYITFLNKQEIWKILENDKVIIIIDGVKLSNSQKNFLYSPQGVLFLLNSYKNGILKSSKDILNLLADK